MATIEVILGRKYKDLKKFLNRVMELMIQAKTKETGILNRSTKNPI
jgi:hypothetical protein